MKCAVFLDSGYTLLKGIGKASGEFGLVTIAYNMKVLHKNSQSSYASSLSIAQCLHKWHFDFLTLPPQPFKEYICPQQSLCLFNA